MPLTTYLTPDATLMLGATTRPGVLDEMVDAVCDRRPDLDRELVRRLVAERDDEIDTCIAPGIALPHARIPGMDGFVVAVGLSPEGVAWVQDFDRPPVRVVALVLGDERRADEHIRVLGQIALVFSQDDVVEQLRDCRDAPSLYDRLLALEEGDAPETPRWTEEQNRAILEHASRLATTMGAGSLIVVGPRVLGRDLAMIEAEGDHARILAAPASPRNVRVDGAEIDSVLNIPFHGLNDGQRVEVVILIALLNDVIRPDDLAICVSGRKQATELDSIHVIDLKHQFAELLALGEEIRRSDIVPEVLHRVLQLANELAIEGREAHPVGTIFVLGDYEAVSRYSHPIIINPFRGYAREEKNILDPSLDETLKEFSLLDGAFVIRGDGEVMSVGTCIQIGSAISEAVSGLGTRHAAGIAISSATSALAVVLSQSTGTVSVYKGGKPILALTRHRE